MNVSLKIAQIIVIGIILSFSTESAWAQSSALKLNLSMGFDRDNDESYIGRLAPVLVIETEKKALHQFEWTSFSIYQFKDNPQDSTTFAIGTYGGADVSWRYQYSVPLTINSEKVIPYLGLSGQVGADYDYKAPAVSDEFSTYAFQLYTRFGLVPALRFQSKKRLFFDVELPLDFIVMDYTWNRTDNPSIPLRQQRTQVMGMEIIRPPLHLRLGMGVKL